MIIKLFGEVAAYVDGRRVDLVGTRERCLLVALLLAKGRPVSRTELLDWIWGDDLPRKAAEDLATLMTRLRNRLRPLGFGEALVGRDGLCWLDIPADHIDVHRFRMLVARAKAVDGQQAAMLLREALQLCSGEPLAGLPGQRIADHRTALTEERHKVEVDFIELELDHGNSGERIADLARLSNEWPYDSKVALLKMQALHLAGRVSDALQAFETHRKQLKNDLGLDVPHKLRQVQEDILKGDIGIDDTSPTKPKRRTFYPSDMVCAVRPVPRSALDAARDSDMPPDGEPARELLRARQGVVLVGDPPNGRAIALHLLGELADRNEIDVVEVIAAWSRPKVGQLPLEPGHGYLLNLNDPATDHPNAAFAEDLLTHLAQLREQGSYVVITARPELWRDCWLAARELTVEHRVSGPPEHIVGEFLALTDPDGRESTYSLSGRRARGPVILGRADPNMPPPDIVLDTGLDSWISRVHCELDYVRGHWWITSRGRNKSLLHRRGANDVEPITARTRLRNGDVIRIRKNLGADWKLEFNDSLATPSARDGDGDSRDTFLLTGDNQ